MDFETVACVVLVALFLAGCAGTVAMGVVAALDAWRHFTGRGRA